MDKWIKCYFFSVYKEDGLFLCGLDKKTLFYKVRKFPAFVQVGCRNSSSVLFRNCLNDSLNIHPGEMLHGTAVRSERNLWYMMVCCKSFGNDNIGVREVAGDQLANISRVLLDVHCHQI